MHQDDLETLHSLVSADTPLVLQGGCSNVGLSRHLRIEIDGLQATPDTLMLWSITRVRREGHDGPPPAFHCDDGPLRLLDQVLAIPSKIYGTEGSRPLTQDLRPLQRRLRCSATCLLVP